MAHISPHPNHASALEETSSSQTTPSTLQLQTQQTHTHNFKESQKYHELRSQSRYWSHLCQHTGGRTHYNVSVLSKPIATTNSNTIQQLNSYGISQYNNKPKTIKINRHDILLAPRLHIARTLPNMLEDRKTQTPILPQKELCNFTPLPGAPLIHVYTR